MGDNWSTDYNKTLAARGLVGDNREPKRSSIKLNTSSGVDAYLRQRLEKVKNGGTSQRQMVLLTVRAFDRRAPRRAVRGNTGRGARQGWRGGGGG